MPAVCPHGQTLAALKRPDDDPCALSTRQQLLRPTCLQTTPEASPALKLFSATLASLTVMEVSMVMDRAYDSVRPIPEALPRCSMASRAAERAARAPRHSNRMLSHLRWIRDRRVAGTETHHCSPALGPTGHPGTPTECCTNCILVRGHLSCAQPINRAADKAAQALQSGAE